MAELEKMSEQPKQCEWTLQNTSFGLRYVAGCQAKKGVLNTYSFKERFCPWCRNAIA